MFDTNGSFIHDHDLEAGVWDGHSYDCLATAARCICFDEVAELAEADDDDHEPWIDYATYLLGR